jgi:hypothetical protein
METVFSVGPPWRYIMRITGQLELELRESLEMVVEWLRRDGKKVIRLWKEEFMCAAVTVRLL